jgi:hypothetical protein
MLQTVAIMGPLRFSVPLTQAVTAPLLGVLHARRAGIVAQVGVCAAIRLVQNAVFLAFFILVIAGGVEAYADSYSAVLGLIGLPEGERAALVATAAGLLAWAAFGSTVQVLVYRRGLRRWPSPREGDSAEVPGESMTHVERRFDPRAVCVAAVAMFALLVSSTRWPLLGAVAAALVFAWAVSQPDREVVPIGAVLALLLGAGVLFFSAIGGSGLDLALRRAVRAALLVVVATWLRAAAGATGLREVSRRALGRFRRLPPAPEAAAVMDELGTGGELGPAARSALGSLSSVPKRPVAVLDAVLGWVATESTRFRAEPPAAPPALAFRLRDAALLVLAAAPAAALLA